MKIRTSLAAVCLGFAVAAITCPASAQELREPHAHVVLNVPDSWTVGQDGDYVMAAPQDASFHLRVVGVNHGEMQESEVEQYLGNFIGRHFNNVQISEHAKRVDWNNYRGWEVFGTGNEKNGNNTPGKFFMLILHDKRNPSKGVVVVGTGTREGFDRHQGGIHEALHSLRTY